MSVAILPNGPLDLASPIRISLSSQQPLAPQTASDAQRCCELLARLAQLGAFKQLARLVAVCSASGSALEVTVSGWPDDASALSVLVRMLLCIPEPWQLVGLNGTAATRPHESVGPLTAALSSMPRVRTPASTLIELSPGLDWFCLELTRHNGFIASELALLDQCCTAWLEASRAGAFSEVSAAFEVTAGDAGMDAPQVGADFWAAQIGSNDLHPAAIGALVNMFDAASKAGMGLSRITVS